jgi:hypothetical protein
VTTVPKETAVSDRPLGVRPSGLQPAAIYGSRTQDFQVSGNGAPPSGLRFTASSPASLRILFRRRPESLCGRPRSPLAAFSTGSGTHLIAKESHFELVSAGGRNAKGFFRSMPYSRGIKNPASYEDLQTGRIHGAVTHTTSRLHSSTTKSNAVFSISGQQARSGYRGMSPGKLPTTAGRMSRSEVGWQAHYLGSEFWLMRYPDMRTDVTREAARIARFAGTQRPTADSKWPLYEAARIALSATIPLTSQIS